MKPEKILLIDTEKNILLTYKPVLEEEGYHVEIAITEEEARGKISQNTFAVVITELYLKGSDTLSIIKSIQKDTPEISIIVLTGNILSPGTYESVLEAGCQDCLSKPFPIKNLLPHINKGIKRRNLLIQLKELQKKIDIFEKSLVDQDGVLYEKNHFIKLFHKEQRRSERYKHPFSLIHINFNFPPREEITITSDTIKEISELLSSNVRHTDYATRFNGSYSLILPETTKSGREHLTKRLGLAMKALNIPKFAGLDPGLDHRIKVTAATFPEESEKVIEFIRELQASL